MRNKIKVGLILVLLLVVLAPIHFRWYRTNAGWKPHENKEESRKK
ncbi:hypothetical protein [Anaerosporobacter sp.]